MSAMNREAFYKAWKDAPDADLRAAIKSAGAEPKATTHKALVDEAWAVYVDQQNAPAKPDTATPESRAPSPVVPVPAFVVPAPAVPPPPPFIQPPAPPGFDGTAPSSAPAGVSDLADDKLKYEGRVIGPLTTRTRAGYRFTREWTTLGPKDPTDEQLEALKADSKYIQVRIKG